MDRLFKEALEKEDLDQVKSLLKEIGDINLKDRNENTPLILVVKNGNLEIAELL
ncbi:ankyrin repeat domain-containing protein [Leptospira kirschneri]|uniref:Ankyrin repeat domain protein n=2 Tax=Leptospira kirschneri TaxID=29507 RepID=A0A0E2B6E8_9LEPT|nr:ankyrin repeat domain-containing protein [Leptospira kirschneri]EKO16905.1 ankyrin repeat domain protein [Leptospira kirschneri str. H1]EKO61862.1 ankyrin repeat domain protein [Leptospira kirschneri str. H2]EMK25297.1 ankyrin repeat domain protein [Leptospira kirschneri serovar Bulgarica str. Nikolaevo]UML81095.1 ankyrin repeat domain-containing protein [Leptospira kirschneri]